jgi:hypothetical protein
MRSLHARRAMVAFTSATPVYLELNPARPHRILDGLALTGRHVCALLDTLSFMPHETIRTLTTACFN